MTVSAGASFYPDDGDDAESLLRNAESALYSAREQKSGNYHFYSASRDTNGSHRLSLETELRQAIDAGELVLHYQPKAFVATLGISGAEALVRWQHPRRGLLLPAEFLEMAEDTGLIVPVGEWVLRQVCNQVMSWIDAGVTPVPVAVNLSSAQFHLEDLLERIGAILNETAMDTHYLAIEITESTIMRDAREAHEILCRLKELGVQVAIDDFGTGYSSLSSLKNLPVHHLKIDRAFIKDLAGSPEDLVITRAVIMMGHGLGLSVIAEGVESHEQLALLRQEGCDELQGFLVSPPLPPEHYETMLRERRQPLEDDSRPSQVAEDSAFSPPRH